MSDLAAEGTFPVFDPVIDPEHRPYWESARAGKLALPRCSRCEAVQWLPRSFCQRHPEADVDWIQSDGRGTVYSFTRVHRGEALFATAAPYVLAYVELREGPRVLTNIVGPTDRLEVGSPVVAVFDQRSENGAILRFALVP